MIDIDFYEKVHELKASGHPKPFEILEYFRSRKPVVYNIETTSAT